MKRKQKYKYLRYIIREKKIKDGFMKRGIFGSIFDRPEKIKRALKLAKNNNHRDYMIRIFMKLAEKSGSENVKNELKGLI